MARQRVASRSELEDGDMRTVEVNGTQVLLVQVEGTIHALGAHCPHQFAPLGEGLLDGPQLLCPWHQSVFEVTSGELVEPPALEGLQTFPVTVEGDDVSRRWHAGIPRIAARPWSWGAEPPAVRPSRSSVARASAAGW